MTENLQDKRPGPNWPTSGEIIFDHVSLFYDAQSPPVVHNLTFKIHPGEKIGIVGRTGSGKTSLISTLFRITEPTGAILIDGITINEPGFGLVDLRSKLSSVAQDPVLFTGTIRFNLDPFGQCLDHQLWTALEQVGLRQKFPSLEARIEDGGKNLSVGQMQLVSIARVLLRQNRILILDEATASMDLETDELIHSRVSSFFPQCTVVMVAHRLHSVMGCDRVMVLGEGQILEFEEPLKLLQNSASAFYNLVGQAGEATARLLVEKAHRAKLLKPNHIK